MQTNQILPGINLHNFQQATSSNFFNSSMAAMNQMLGFMQLILATQLGQLLTGQGGFVPSSAQPSFGQGAVPSPSSTSGNFLGGQSSGGGSSAASKASSTAASSSSVPTGSPSKTAKATGTGYYPDNSAMEGGYVDRKGAKLRTLQDFLAGKADYVSVAMDKNMKIPYGTKLRIPELEKKYGRPIEFRVVDTGGAFTGKGNSRIDICTASKKDSLDSTINGPLTLQFY